MMKCLHISIHLFYTLSIAFPLRIHFNERFVGVRGKNDTELKCSFEQEGLEEVLTLQLLAKNLTSDEFFQIVRFRPDKPSILLPGGAYLSDRATFSNLTSLIKTATLTFQPLDCRDETAYQCKISYYAVGGEEAYVEKSTKLIVTVNPSLPELVYDKTSASEGASMSFLCSGNVGKPPGSFIWQKSNSGIISDTHKNVSTEYTLLPDSCSYHGTSNITIQVTDEYNNVVIRCSVNNSFFAVQAHPTLPLNVYYKVRKPSISRLPMKNEYLEGTDLILLTCESRGNPQPSYTWFKDGSMDAGLSFSNIFIIKEVITNNSGLYRCNVSNIIYDIEYTQSTAVTIIIVPANIDSSTTTTTKIMKQDESVDTAGIVFGVIASVLLIALVAVVTVCLNINRKIRLTLQNNYDNLRFRESPGQESRDAAYDGIIINSTTDVSQYETPESTTHIDTQRTTSHRADYENHRTGDRYEYAYVNPSDDQSGATI